MDKNGGSYIPGLHGLRAIAAIAVIAYHIAPYSVKGGYLGVCLFFVLSGFLLAARGTVALAKRKFSVLEFYKARIRRIYPSLLIFLFGICGILYIAEPELLKGTRSEIFSVVFGYHNWWQIIHEGSYFSQISASSPFRHIWSLAMELQFYLLYPVFFIILLALLKLFKKKAALSIYAIIVILTAVPMSVAIVNGVDISRIYYGSDLRLYAILFGMFGGFFSVGTGRRGEMKHKKLSLMLSLGILVAIIVCFFVIDGQYESTYLFGMQLICAAMALLSFLVADGRLRISRWLDIAPLRYIGSRTYEIYLWHYPLIVLLQYKGYGKNPAAVAGMLALTLILAEWTVRIKKFISGSVSRRVPYIAASVLMAVIALIGVVGIVSLSGQEKFDTAGLEQELNENEEFLANIGTTEETDDADAADSTEEDETADPVGDSLAVSEDEEKTEPDDGIDHTLVTMVGDSVALGAAPKILETFPNVVVDAEKSRQLRGSMEVFERLEEEGNLGGTVIIELGTNGPFREDEGQEIIDFLGENRSIYWINVNGEHLEWTQRVNDLIAVLAAKNVNVSKINWSAEAKEHPDWFYDDGIHLQKEGQEGYAEFLYDIIYE